MSDTEPATRYEFAVALLDKLGMRTDWPQVTVIVAWCGLENTRAANNPLATTLHMPGSTLFNSAGVQNYQTLETGVQATVSTLTHKADERGYRAILNSLARTPEPADSYDWFMAARKAIADSAWSGSTNYLIPFPSGLLPIGGTK